MFEKNSIGIDIADYSIEVVEVTKELGKTLIKNKGRVLIGSGIVEKGRIKDKKKLATAVREALRGAKPQSITGKNIVFGLPESVAFTQTVSLGKGSGKDEEDILEEVYKVIPINKKDVVISHIERPDAGGGQESLILAVSREVLLEWGSFFKGLGLNVDAFDAETLALRRGIFGGVTQKTVAIVDIGSRTTNISIFVAGKFRHSHTIPIAGEAITEEISKAFSLSTEEAEKLKRSEGMKEMGSKCSNAICKVLGPIAGEVKSTLDFFSKSSKNKTQSVILVGGTSNISGIAYYFSENLGAPVEVGKIFAKTSGRDSFLYIGAAGLAIGGVDDSWDEHDPRITSETLETETDAFAKTGQKDVGPSQIMAMYSKYTEAVPKKVLILGALLVIGVISISGAFVYRSQVREAWDLEQTKAFAQLDEAMKELDQATSTEMVAEIATSTTEKKDLEVAAVEEKVLIKETGLGYLNVRSGPSTGFSIVTTINPGEIFVVLEKKEGWYKLDLSGDDGWVAARYVNSI
jgi:type IV pilus assembly protein PilM